MTQITTELSYVKEMQTWNSGGDVMLDVIELESGLTLVVGEETVSVYPTVDDFWAECDDGEHRAVTTLLRESGEVFALLAP